MYGFLHVVSAVLLAVARDVLHHVSFGEAELVGVDVLDGLDCAVLVVTTADLHGERVGHHVDLRLLNPVPDREALFVLDEFDQVAI